MSVTGHNHDASGAPTYPDYRDRCPVGCDDLTPVRMADTNVQLVGKDRLVTRRLVPDGPSQFAMTTPPRTPTTAAGRALLDEYPGVWFWEDPRWNGPLGEAIEAEAPAPLDVERLARALGSVVPEPDDEHEYTVTDDLWYAAAIAREYAKEPQP